MELSWVYRLEPLLIFGAGAFVGAYLKKKGENLATHEDIDKLVDQIKAVTIATKEIEAKISGDLWDRQKRWELKRDVLFELTKRIPLAGDALSRMVAVYTLNKAAGDKHDPFRSQQEVETFGSWITAVNALEGSILLAKLVCDPSVAIEVRAYCLLGRRLASATSKGNPEAYTEARDEILLKTNAALAAIRKEIENRN